MASAIPRPLIVSAPADRAAATTSWPSTCKREASLRPIRPVPPKIAIFIMLRSVLELLEVQPSWATAMRQDRDRPYVLYYPLSFAGICDIAAGFVFCSDMVPFRRVLDTVSALSRPCPPAALPRRVSGPLVPAPLLRPPAQRPAMSPELVLPV